MERRLLETFLGESGLPTVADLAQSVAVAAAMVCQNTPTNLKSTQYLMLTVCKITKT